MTPKARAQRQLAPIRHGLYVRTPNGRQLKDRAVQRLVAKVRQAMPWLTTADLPAARAWCELEIAARLLFAEMRATGFVTDQGEPRRLLGEWRLLRASQLAYTQALGMTPAARRALLDEDQGDAVARFHGYLAGQAKPAG